MFPDFITLSFSGRRSPHSAHSNSMLNFAACAFARAGFPNEPKLSVGGLLQYPRVDECSSIFLYVSSYSHEETEIIHS